MVPRMLRTPRAPWPASIPVEPRQPPTVGADETAITFIGHATFLVQFGATNVLIDPMFAERASPVSFAGPRRVRAPGIRLEDLPPISVVLLSHNHYDHCDARSLATIERQFHPTFITPVGNALLLRSLGIVRVLELDWWEFDNSTGLPTTLTPAQHFSARGPFDRNRALWGGFVVQAGQHRIYFAGDSGYGEHFREIGKRLGPIDLALLPIGAYEPRWFMKDVHMNPAEAVQAHLDVGARRSWGMHFGTFQLTAEGIDEPVRDLGRALRERDVAPQHFHAPDVGESLRLG